jgi:hypothetical protein
MSAKEWLIFAALIVTMAVTAYSADQYIQVTGDNVNIRFSPSTSSQIITVARKGDIFKLEGEEQEWYAISMFSGEYRYIHKSLAQELFYEPIAPGSVSVRQQMYRAFWDLEGKAMAEADRRHPPTVDVMKNIEYSRILEDKYKLAVVHQFNTQAPIYTKIAVEGAENSW